MTPYYLEFTTANGRPFAYVVPAPSDAVALKFGALLQEGYNTASRTNYVKDELFLFRFSRKPSRGVEYKEL